jgi:hypothetical protein
VVHLFRHIDLPGIYEHHGLVETVYLQYSSTEVAFQGPDLSVLPCLELAIPQICNLFGSPALGVLSRDTVKETEGRYVALISLYLMCFCARLRSN